MCTLSSEGSKIILAFSSLFPQKVFEHVKVLILATLVTIGDHTVCAALRFMGLRHEDCFHKYHRVLSTVKWSGMQASKILLQLLVKRFGGSSKEPLVFATDETIEGRRGLRLKPKAFTGTRFVLRILTL